MHPRYNRHVMPDRPEGKNKDGGTKCEICTVAKVKEDSTWGLCNECEKGVKELLAAMYELSGGSMKPVPLEDVLDLAERRMNR